MIRLSVAIGVSLILCGCTLGPDYTLPDDAKVNDPSAQGNFVENRSPALVADPVPAGWWHLFEDPRLDALEQEALAANADLRVATANLERAQAVFREVAGLRELRGDASFSAERSQPSGESYLVDKQLPSMYLGDGSASVSYQIDLFGRLKRAAEAARYDQEASRAGLELARVTIAAHVAAAFVEACAAGHELETVRRQVALQEQTEGVTRRLVDAGRDSTIALTLATGQLEQTRAALPPLEARQRAALYQIAALTGHAPGDYPKGLERCTALPGIRRPLPVGDGAALLKRRPDVRQAERALAAATARIGVATAALYPDITLGANIGAIGQLADLGQPAAQTWAIGSLISWTFPTGSERAKVAEASASASAALARFDGVVLNALRETETSLARYRRDLDRNGALRAARDRAAEAGQQTLLLVSAGRSPTLNGLSARQSLAQAEQALAISDSQVSQDQVQLFLALGGGWTRE